MRQLALERGDVDLEDPNIRAEIMQLKQRLAGTDQELQKTNHTLRYVCIIWREIQVRRSSIVIFHTHIGHHSIL